MPTFRILCVLAVTMLLPVAGYGADVALAGVFGAKAVLIVNGGAPRTLSVGQSTPEGVKLIELSERGAVVDIEGRRQEVVLGQSAIRISGQPEGSEARLMADSRGHYYGSGTINGAGVRYLVDTGATMVSMGASEARRAGMNLRTGTQIYVQTANGMARAWQMRIDTIVVEGITLHGVDALVHEGELPIVLLGMSFLNRMDMQREGGQLLLRKRF